MIGYNFGGGTSFSTPTVAGAAALLAAFSRAIGSYDISILPHQDSCSFMMPDNPVTHSFRDELELVESPLDVDGLVEAALERCESVDFSENASWNQMPDPVVVEA